MKAVRSYALQTAPKQLPNNHIKPGAHTHLLHAEPGDLVLDLLHHGVAAVAVVGGVRGAVRQEGLAHDKNVVAATEEGILEDGAGADEDIRVFALSLGGTGAIKVPHGELRGVLGDLGQRAGCGLGSQIGINAQSKMNEGQEKKEKGKRT